MKLNILTEKQHIPLQISATLYSQICYAHSQTIGVEWSGLVFYDTEGDIEDPETFKIVATEFYLLDIGTAAYTEFKLDTNIIDIFQERPHLFGKPYGLIHSHHSMTTFFSGTDTSNLHESAEFFNYYLSLIVNHSGEYCAKISMRGKTEDKVSSIRYYKNKKGELYSKVVTTEANEDCIFIYDCDITIDKGGVTDANAAQIAKLKAAKTTYTSTYNYYNSHTKTWDNTPKTDYGSGKYVKNRGEHIARAGQYGRLGESTVKGLLENWDDYDFSKLNKKEKQLTIFPPKDGPEENYIEEIIEKICGKKITDIEFDAYLQGTAIQGHRTEYLTEAEEAITENMQYLYDVKASALQQERTNLIMDLRKKLTYHSYQAPQEFFELIKEAFDNEFKYSA